MTKEEIYKILDKNPGAVAYALMTVFNNQEVDEQDAGETRHDNGRGFNGADAGFLTSVAKRVRWKRRFGNDAQGIPWKDCLSDNELIHVRKAIKKYWGQYQAAFEEIQQQKEATRAERAEQHQTN